MLSVDELILLYIIYYVLCSMLCSTSYILNAWKNDTCNNA